MSLKRKFTQNELRKAMSEHKKKYESIKKIESPLAKYTDAGQLMCILCKVIVRSETVWPVHLNSKAHKENITVAKKTRLEPEQNTEAVTLLFKRPISPNQEFVTNKRIKGILKHSSSIPTRDLPGDFFDNTSEQQNNSVSDTLPELQTSESSQEALGIVSITNIEGETGRDNEKGRDTSHSILPERFFDDPIMDAKVRNVEYKDPVEEEWEKFQKEIKEETAQSAQIIAEDQEEATNERQLDEIEEQIQHWSRVMDLVKRKEEVQATDRKQDSFSQDVSSGDEAEFDEFLDWRAKNAYK